MKIQFSRVGLAVSSAVLLMSAGCGGGGDSIGAALQAITSVSTTVVDGAIRNAVVCMDKNGNGLCDAGEVQGRTDIDGKVTIDVPSADVGKFPIIALVGLDAVDKDHGPVLTAYAMSAPADQSGVVSPLTTLVQQTVALTGATSADAAKAVQATTGITASLFDDFTKSASATGGGVDPATVARLVVVTTQQQSAQLAGAVGSQSLDGSLITQAHIDTAVRKKLLELLPDLVAALADPAVTAATDPRAKEALLLAAATTLATNSGLNSASVATVVAVNTQGSTPAPVVTEAPSAGFSLANLNFTSATDYFIRALTSSAAQNTADADKNVKFVERRVRSVSGNVAHWGSGGEPARGTDLHFNGTSWVNCPVNFESINSVRDAAGNSTYNYCDGFETGKSKRIVLDVAGKLMSAVYAQLRVAGYTNFSLGDAAVLGTAMFPAGSSVHYQVSTPLTEAVAYYPGSSSWVAQYTAAVSAGGNATTQAAGAGCNSTEFKAPPGVGSTTLETLIGSMTGTPCMFPQGSFTYNSVKQTSPDASDEAWGNSTLGIGSIGTAPVGTGTAPGFYTGNTKLRIAFKGDGVKAVTYYACKERFNNGSLRNCTVIAQGSYTITQLGDGRTLTLNGLPALIATLPTWALVERGGHVYRAYQNKPTMLNTARLNSIASTALLSQLDLPAIDPSTPFSLTAGSYQGTWDVTDPAAPGSKTVLSILPDGRVTCQDGIDPTSHQSCSVTFSDPTTGAFQFTSANSAGSGTFNYLAGTASGTWYQGTTTGHIVAQRR
ncbi:MAG: hypothetical protein H7306_03835 [Bacteriovorax sp.]|nr:hypothetical protein [Rhizobacter sp.]